MGHPILNRSAVGLAAAAWKRQHRLRWEKFKLFAFEFMFFITAMIVVFFVI